MEWFLHQFASGLANGAIYGCLALALVMIYQSTHHINFAQGEMATFSTYLAWELMQRGVPSGPLCRWSRCSFLGGVHPAHRPATAG